MFHRYAFAVVVLLALPVAPAVAQTTLLRLESQPGDWVGEGQTVTYTLGNGTFSASNPEGETVAVSFNTPTYSHWWNLYFSAPEGQVLAPGAYEGAMRWPFQSPTRPGLSVSGDGRGCNTLTGRFVVLELEYGSGGEVAKFAADFEQHCEGEVPALFGSIRINSAVSVAPRVTIGDVTVVEDALAPTPAVFTIGLSHPPPAPVMVDYATADGTAVAGTDYVATSGMVTLDASQWVKTVNVLVTSDGQAAGDKVFYVDLVHASGAPVADGQGRGTILDTGDGDSWLLLNSEPGDWVGQGQLQKLTRADGVFSVERTFDDGVDVQFSGNATWNVVLAAPQGAPLTPGVYEGATRWPFQSSTDSGLSVSGDGRGCNTLTGRFVVLEAEYAIGGEVERFAANLEQHCEGSPPALFAAIRFHSSVAPTADLAVAFKALPLSITPFQPVSYTFVVTNNGPNDVTGATVSNVITPALDGASWTCSGSGGATCGAGSGNVADVADLPLRATATYTVQGTVPADAQSLVSTASAWAPGGITEWNPANNQATADSSAGYGGWTTFLYMQSQPGDWVGGGQVHLYLPPDGQFVAGADGTRTVSASFETPTFSHWWNLHFSAPEGQVLAPGAYEGATRWPFQSPTRPGLSVSGDGRGCNRLTGRFVVLEVEYGSGGELLRFAADFEQHCEGLPPALFGSIRINSAIRVEPYVTLGDVTVVEDALAPTPARFTIGLSLPPSAPVTVDYATGDGTAAAGTDYVATSGTVTLDANQWVKTVTVWVTGDGQAAGDKVFYLDLVQAVGAPVADGQGRGTILDTGDGDSWLLLNSAALDWVGQGQLQKLTRADGVFSVQGNAADGLNVHFSGSAPWDVALAAPEAALLLPGVYEGATRWPFQSSIEPGLSVSGDGRGCNTLTGGFVVLEAEYAVGGEVERFAANFEQHCEGAPPALIGAVRYHSLAGASADLAVAITSAPVRVRQGQEVTYTFAVTNNGPDTVHGATVTWVSPLSSPAWSCAASGGALCGASGLGPLVDSADLPVRGTVVYTVEGRVPDGFNPLVGTAAAATPAGTLEWSPGNNSASTSAPVTPSSRGDFDRDGFNDLLWRNVTTGAVAQWYMEDTVRKASAAVVASSSAGDRVVGTADFNGDSAPDVLWQNEVTGALRVAFLSVATQIGEVPTVPAGAGPGQRALATGDFNSDGKPDILWRDRRNDALYVWLMDGVLRTERRSLGFGPPFAQGLGVAAGDLDGDEHTDLVWGIPGTAWPGTVGPPPIPPLGPSLHVWFMQGTQVVRKTSVSAPSPPGRWTLAAVADYDGDLRDDIVWQDQTTGSVLVWHMDGATVRDVTPTTPSTNGPLDWKVVAPR